MAVAGFKGFGWLLCGVVVSPGLYLVTSQVAAERGRVNAVERAIAQAERDLRDLETEFQTRANFSQLERWNGDILALAAPRPEQYAGDEAALAALNPNRVPTPAEAAQVAALVVPAAVEAPELQLAEAAAPAPAQGEAAAPALAPVSTVAVAAARIRLDPPKAEARAAATASGSAQVAVRSVAAATSAMAKAPRPLQAMAMLDRKLLDDATLGDLLKSARAEAARRR